MSDPYTPEQIENLVRQAAKAGYEAVDTTGRSWDELVQEHSPFHYGKEMRRARAIIATVGPALAASALLTAADKIGPYPLNDPAITDPSTGEYVQGASMAIMLAPDGEDASTVRGYLRALAEEVRP